MLHFLYCLEVQNDSKPGSCLGLLWQGKEGVEVCEPRVCRDLAKVNGMCMKKRKSKMEEE